MSVWPECSSAGVPALTGAQGDLVLVSIAVKARRLEALLETLADLPFPVNPEIYHDAAVVCVYQDGRREAEPVVLVDFPAYAVDVGTVKRALSARGFPDDAVWARNLLEGILSEEESRPAPEGAAYTTVIRQRHMATAA